MNYFIKITQYISSLLRWNLFQVPCGSLDISWEPSKYALKTRCSWWKSLRNISYLTSHIFYFCVQPFITKPKFTFLDNLIFKWKWVIASVTTNIKALMSVICKYTQLLKEDKWTCLPNNSTKVLVKGQQNIEDNKRPPDHEYPSERCRWYSFHF